MLIDPIMPVLVVTVLALAALGLAMKLIRQPLLVGYVLAGLVLGPYGLSIITDAATMSRIGAVGVILLLFFIGIAVEPADLRSNWRVAILGTTLQIVCSSLAVIGFGTLLDWPIARSVLLGFVISMSSTAIVMKLLEDGNLLDTQLGRDAFSITLVQDLAVVPMILILTAMAGDAISSWTLGLQAVAALAFIWLIFWLSKPREIRLPFGKFVEKDHELQVLLAIAFCFGVGLFSALMGLSSAFGAFIAGITLRIFREAKWVETGLSGFRIVFVALFFASVGMLLDIGFLEQHWFAVAALSLMVIILNTLIVTVILVILGRPWRHSIEVAAMLSQIGEFSFVLAAIGKASGLIAEYSYDMTVSVIVITLAVCPLWIALIRLLVRKTAKAVG